MTTQTNKVAAVTGASGGIDELVDRFAKMNPRERLGTPEDIAAAVAFLVGPDGGWINGLVLRANGGMV